MTANNPRRLALVLAAATALLAPAAPLQAQGLAPSGPAATAFPCTDAEDRRATIDGLRRKQRLAGAALIGIGVPAGIMLARSRNEWNPVDEGWIGLGIAGWSAASGLFLLLEPLSWRTAGTEGRIHAAQGAAARRLRHGRGGGAALSIAW